MASRGVKLTATGTVSAGPATLYSISAALSTAGTITVRNGGAGGEVVATVDLATGNAVVPIPFGLLCLDGIHATFTTAVGGVTFWI